MLATEQLLDDIAGAVLDGTAVDWAAVESSADDTARAIVEHLRLLASVAQVHRDQVPGEGGSPRLREETPTPKRWGHLRLLERIGRGAFGEVFRAWDTRLDREVALKLLPAPRSSVSDDESSIIREGRLLAKVQHPNVVTIYGAEQIANRIGLWMEFVRGRTLEQLVRQDGAFRAPEVVAIGVELCRAVSAVHAAGLLHRDIKAHNVVRAADGRVVLMDFGAGRELNDSSSSDLTGTPLYLAPEVLTGGPATVQSDVYSLGVLLYYLASGSFPVAGRTIRDVRQGLGEGKRVGIRTVRPDLSPAVARVIERASDPQPERRHESVDAIARDLAALQRPPWIGALRYGMAAAAAVLVIALLALEVRARLTGDDRSFAARLTSLISGPTSPVEHPVIAVLPFRKLGNAPDGDLLADFITAGLIRQLGDIDGLSVKSPTSSFMLKDKPRALADVGKLLGVNLVVEGDAQLSDGTLLVRASLVPVDGGMSLWADTFDRRLASEGDLVGVIEDLTRKMVNGLRLKVGRTQRRYQTDLATFGTYLKARELSDARRSRQAIPLFAKVTEADPSYAPAKAALAAAYGDLASHYPLPNDASILPSDAVALMAPLAKEARDADPTLAEAHAAWGYLHAFARRWEQAETSFREAIDLDPTNTGLKGDFVSSVLLPWGRLDEARDVMTTALDADPLSLDARRVLSLVQLADGLYSEAWDNCQQVLDRDPTFPFADHFCTWARLFKGERAEALAELEELSKNRTRLGVVGQIHAINDRRADAEAIAAGFDHLPQRQAEIYGLLGDTDRVLEALERLAVLNPIRAGFELVHPAVGLQQADRRVKAFRRRLGFPD